MTAHIVFGCDDDYIKYCAVSITSIILGLQKQIIPMGGGAESKFA